MDCIVFFWGMIARSGYYRISDTLSTMKPPPSDPFEKALEQYRNSQPDLDLTGFERGVWSRISSLGKNRYFERGFGFIGIPRLLAGALAGAVVGLFLAWLGASLYGEHQRQQVEQRYVESIHPIWRSNHQHDHAAL
jgi:hypothetical protein